MPVITEAKRDLFIPRQSQRLSERKAGQESQGGGENECAQAEATRFNPFAGQGRTGL